MSRTQRRAHPRCLRDLVRAGVLLPVLPTTDGGFRLYGVGRRLMPALTNYIKNPRLVDSNADGLADDLTILAANCTVTKSVEARGDGTFIQKVRIVGNAGATTDPEIHCSSSGVGTFAPGDPIYQTLMVRAIEITGCSVSSAVNVRNAADGQVRVDSQAVSVTADYVLKIGRRGSAEANTSQARGIYVYAASDFHQGDVMDVWFHSPTLTKTPVPEMYFDGTMPDCAWSGTADLSASALTQSLLEYPAQGLLAAGGTFAGRFVAGQPASVAAAHRLIAHPSFKVYYGSGNFSFAANDGGSWVAANKVASFLAGTLHTFVARWSGTKLDVMLDGSAATQANRPAPDFSDGALTIAASPTQLDGFAGPELAIGARLSDLEATNLSAALAAGTDHVSLQTRYVAPYGGLVMPLTVDSVAYRRVR